jgi:hypothetical protein
MIGTLAAQPGHPPTRGHIPASVQVRLELSTEIDDFAAFLADPGHEAAVSGTVVCPDLGGSRPIEDGRLRLFPRLNRAADSQMQYRLWFRDGAGEAVSLIGAKTLRVGRIRDVWRHVTVMDAELVRGHADARKRRQADVLASGPIRLPTRAVVPELASIRGRGPSMPARAFVVARFTLFFARSVVSAYSRHRG